MKDEYYQACLDAYKPKMYVTVKIIYDNEELCHVVYDKELEDMIEGEMYKNLIEGIMDGSNRL